MIFEIKENEYLFNYVHLANIASVRVDYEKRVEDEGKPLSLMNYEEALDRLKSVKVFTNGTHTQNSCIEIRNKDAMKDFVRMYNEFMIKEKSKLDRTVATNANYAPANPTMKESLNHIEPVTQDIVEQVAKYHENKAKNKSKKKEEEIIDTDTRQDIVE